MPIENIPLTIEIFDQSNWQEIIENSDKKECHYYSSAFLKRARECEEKNDQPNQEIYSIFGGLTSMMLKSESPTEPYQPVAVFNDRRSAIIDDYSNDVINLLSDYLETIDDPELRARIADVVWLRKRDFLAAQTAINSYLESAILLEHPEKWTQCVERIERAFRLSLQLGKNGDLYKKVLNHIESVIKKYDGSDPLFLSQRLMALLLEVRHGDPQYYIDLSERISLDAEKSGNYYRARSYWEIKASWHRLASDKEGEKESLKNAAETYVKEAASATSGLAASTHQQKAIEAYRRFGGDKERIEELHVTLLEYQEKTLSKMNSYSSPAIDISESIKKSIDRVKGKTLHDAIFELVLMVPSPDIKELRKEVEESVSKYPLQHLFPSVKVNEKGKVTAKASSMLSSDPSEVEQAFRESMFRNLEFHHQIYAQSVIEPVRKQISLEHNVRIQDFYPIVSNNPFVPQGREYLYALGFKLGIDGDYEVSLHLLIPQFENSIRHILTEAGKITSGIDSDGIQDEKSLHTTLYLPEIKELIDENIIFDLQGLLVERFGANLRNLMAHGLMSHHEFYSHNGRYLWCLMLKLCCLPIIRYLREQEVKETKNGRSGVALKLTNKANPGKEGGKMRGVKKFTGMFFVGLLISCIFQLLTIKPSNSEVPTVSSIAPAIGTTVSNTHVTITGENFEPGAKVSLINGGPFLAGSYETNRASDVYVSGNYAYVADGEAGLKVIDISDPVSPVLAGSYETPGKAHEVYVSGDYAYVALNYSWLGLLVIDISTPSTPILTGKVQLDNGTVSMHISGNYAYLIDYYYLQVIDISDPVAPERVALLPLVAMETTLLDVYASGDYAYVTRKYGSNENSSTLFLVDVSDSTSPVVVSSIEIPVLASSLYASDDYLYLAGSSGLQIVDISDPTVPALAGFIDVSDPRGRAYPYFGYPPVLPPDIYVSGDYAYIVKESGLLIIDINDPAAPVLVSYYESQGNIYDVALSVHVSDDYVYLIGKGLQVVDVKNLRPRMYTGRIDINAWDAPAKTLNVRTIGDYAYVSTADVDFWDTHNWLSLLVIDVSDPASPTLQNSARDYTWPSYPSYPDIAGMYASTTDLYVADMSGFSWVNISDPTALAGGGEVASGRLYEARGVHVSGDYAYVTYFEDLYYSEGPSKAWLWVINISDSISSTEERVVSKLKIRGAANDVYTSGGYAYVASGKAGLLVIDISDPTEPFLVTKYDTPGGARGVHVSGSYAYLADGKTGLLVIDISDPTEPELVNSYHTPGAANGIYVSDNYAYLASGSAGLQVIDIKTPTVPFLANSIDTPGIAYGVHASGDYAYLANGFAGLFVIDINDPVTNVVVADSSTITATFPEGLPEGPYHILVTNPGGQPEEAYLYNAFKMAPAAPGITVTDSVFPFDDLQIPFGNVLHKMYRNRFIQMVSIANNGSASLNIGTIAKADVINLPFSITEDSCSNQTLAPSANCRLTIRFKPTVPGSFNDTFDIPSNDPDENYVTISVSGSKSRKMIRHR